MKVLTAHSNVLIVLSESVKCINRIYKLVEQMSPIFWSNRSVCDAGMRLGTVVVLMIPLKNLCLAIRKNQYGLQNPRWPLVT